MAEEEKAGGEKGTVPATKEEADSAVAASIDAKGTNSYYYAHAKPREDLTEAKRIEGDGSRRLADIDGGPAQLDKPDEWLASAEKEEEKEAVKIRWREDYAWGDDGAKVKIYVDFPEGSLKADAVRVESKFGEKSFELRVLGLPSGNEGVKNGEHELSNAILPDKCSHRINSAKSRVTITLVKQDSAESWSNLKKKNISKHTGWN